jgi:hypothetical protein
MPACGSAGASHSRLLFLAGWAEEGCTLSLNDAAELAAYAATRARFAGSIIHAVVLLVAAFFVEGVAVSAIAERRAFVADRRFENELGGIGDCLPLSAGNFVTTACGMDFAQVENFGRIQVADSCDGMLIEQRNLDWSFAGPEAFAKEVGGHGERVGTDFSGFECCFELGGRKQANTSQATAVPIHEFADLASSELAAKAEVFSRGRISNKDEAGHAWFENNGVAGIQMDDNSFADAADIVNSRSHYAATEVIDARRDGDWATSARGAFDVLDPGTDDAQDAAAHRFNFGKFGHKYNLATEGTEITESSVRTLIQTNYR